MEVDEIKQTLAVLRTHDLNDVIEYGQKVLEERAKYSETQKDWSSVRIHQRHDCKFRATYVRHTPAVFLSYGNDRVKSGSVMNISQGGLQMITDVELSPSEVITVLLMSENQIERKVYVEIRSCVPTADAFDVGGMFISREELGSAERIYWDHMRKRKLHRTR